MQRVDIAFHRAAVALHAFRDIGDRAGARFDTAKQFEPRHRQKSQQLGRIFKIDDDPIRDFFVTIKLFGERLAAREKRVRRARANGHRGRAR